jgi:hypothetical protein
MHRTAIAEWLRYIRESEQECIETRTNEDGSPGVHLQGCHQHAVVEDSRQLGVRQRQCPQPQVAGRVAHSSKHELYGVNHLRNGRSIADAHPHPVLKTVGKNGVLPTLRSLYP